MNSNPKASSRHRTRVGERAALLGFFCNLILSAVKLTLGTVLGSVTVLADGWNNLSDSASSAITWLGFRFSAKPADAKHPYGHARLEYLSGLLVAMMVPVIGFELGKSSVEKIFHPEAVNVSSFFLAVLAVSALVKLALFWYYRQKGKSIGSKSLLAASADSRGDALVTLAVIVSAVTERWTGWRIDGITGLLLSVFLLVSGVRMAMETVSALLGEGGDPEIKELITARIRSCPQVLGCHDLMIHDYGPHRRYGSVHVETSASVGAMECHELLDRMERECKEEYGIALVIHHDPILPDDPETERMRQWIRALLKMRDPRLEIHDFRIRRTKPLPELAFDVSVPDDLSLDRKDLTELLGAALSGLEEREYSLDITVDPS